MRFLRTPRRLRMVTPRFKGYSGHSICLQIDSFLVINHGYVLTKFMIKSGLQDEDLNGAENETPLAAIRV